jgi:hypothetical protein
MGLYAISGTISATGQYTFDNDIHVYACVEITDSSGARRMIDKVAVCNDANVHLAKGLSGEFFSTASMLIGEKSDVNYGVSNLSIGLLSTGTI